MPNIESYFDDFQFIIHEINRIQQLSRVRNTKTLNRWDWFCYLDHPSGRGSLLIGRAADQRFNDITQKALQNSKLAHRVDVATLKKAIQYLFRENILVKKRELTSALANQIVARAVIHVQRKKLIDLSHYFPCVLPLDNETDQISIGPVEFMAMKKFLELNNERLKNVYVEKETREYFAHFPWIASISVNQFDEEKSLAAGRVSAETALNILKLFLGSSYGEDIYLSETPKANLMVVYLNESKEKAFRTSYRRKWEFQTIKGWIRKVTEGRSGNWLAHAGSLIPDPASDESTPLTHRRLINGLWWYGEALNQEFFHIKVIQFCNALESFLVTRKENITHQLSSRVSSFMRIRPVVHDWIPPDKDWAEQTRKLYDFRSDLVHGTLSPFSNKAKAQASWGAHIVREVLMEGLFWTAWLARNNPPKTLKSLHARFESDIPKFAAETQSRRV